MNKTFCDFCGKEIHIGEICNVHLEEPNKTANEPWPIVKSFDCCQECFDKIAKAIGIKK